MKRLLISDAAGKDLASIGEYTERTWGSSQKLRYLAVLKEAFQRIQQRPAIGRPRDDIGQGYRSLTCMRHVVFYRESEESVEVLRLLHEKMDVHRHLKSDAR